MSLIGASSGTANATPLSKAIPKSMPNTSPSFNKKFSRCLSPIPKIYEEIEKVAYDLMNHVLIFKNASDVKHRFSSPFQRRSYGKNFLCKSKFSITFFESNPRAF